MGIYIYSSSVNRDSGDTIIGYDAYNRLTQVKDSRTGVTTTTYRSDISDAVIAVQPPAGATQTTSYTYDHRSRRTHVDAPNSFDPAGSPGNTNLTNITVTSYNPSGTVASVTGAQNYPISYTYDYADRIKSMTTSSSSGNVITAWNYSTTTGLLTSRRYNSNLSGTTGTGPSYLYTSAGRLSKRTWARPISTANATLIATNYTYTYGLLSAVTYNDGTPNLAYTYDSLGRMKTVSRAGSSHYIYNYDATTLRLSSEQQNIDSFPRNLLRYYDSLGRPLSLDLTTTANVSDYTTGYAFDAAGRLQNVWHHPALDVTSKAPSGAATFKYGYTYTQATATDLRAGFTSGADLKQDYIPYTITRNASGSDPALTATRTYEANRDALRSIVNKSGTSEISSYTYSVNAIIQRESVTTAGSAFAGTQADWLWQYDPLGQVVRADHANTADSDRVYEYDNIGNRIKTASGTLTLPTSVNWVSNALNQYTTADGVALPTTPAPAPFDLDGNMTAGPVPGTNGNIPAVQAPANATDIKWDAENRLISLTLGTTVYSYSYDHLSRLISCSTGGTVNARYAYDGWNRIAQYDETTLQDTFTWGLDISGSMQGAGGVGGLLATRWVSSSNTDYFPTYDGNGNVSEYLATDGTSSVHYEYDPFGTLTRRTGSSSTRFQYRFSTKPRDIDTGLYYYGYRYYHPNLGRWLSRDPIQERGGMNLYGFVGNDLRFVDILGLEADASKQKFFSRAQPNVYIPRSLIEPNQPTTFEKPDWLTDKSTVTVVLFYVQRSFMECNCCFYTNINPVTGILHASNNVSNVSLLIKKEKNGKCGSPAIISAVLGTNPRQLYLPTLGVTIQHNASDTPSYFDFCKDDSFLLPAMPPSQDLKEEMPITPPPPSVNNEDTPYVPSVDDFNEGGTLGF